MRLTIKATKLNKDRKKEERNRWNIIYGDTQVGHIVCDKDKILDIASDLHLSSADDVEPSKKYSEDARIWRVYLHRGFDPCCYPHEQVEDNNYVTVQENKLCLTCPYYMTIDEARLWTRKHFNREMFDI